MRLLVGLTVALVLAGCGDGPSAAPPPSPDARPVLPEGWRWESYRDAEVGVPGDWGWTSSGRLDDWCASATLAPAVGRPGRTAAIRCRSGTEVLDPGALIAEAGTIVAFVPTSQGTVVDEGDRIALIPDGLTQVVIQAEPALREQIAATVHRITDGDHSGCAVHHPVAEDLGWRPAPGADATPADVDALRVCRYTELEPAADAGPTVSLFSSLRLTGDAAREALAGVAEAPEGSGPNRPGRCTDAYGDGAIVLQALRGPTVVAEVVLRYAGCEHRGFDDGTSVRRLTPKSCAPFVVGPNQDLAAGCRA